MNNAKYSIGIDMGGTNTKFGIVDRDGNVLFSSEVSTTAAKKVEDLIFNIYTVLKPHIEDFGGNSEFVGVGIGAPNGNVFTGNIEFAPNLPWTDIIPLSKIVAKQFNMPCKVTNDANAAAMGEMQYGAAKSMKNFIMITLGTGVGSGIVVDGNIVYGHDGFAGELGHIIIIPNGRIHPGTQIRGSLESYCSATGVRVTALEKLAETDRPSLLRNVSAEELTSKYIFEAALQGDEIAKEIFQFTGEILGIAFANFIMTTSPEAIILYGGLARSGELLIRPLKITMENHLLKIFKGKVKILLSHLKSSDAAILGASALMW